MNLKNFSDRVLLQETKRLAGKEREVSVQVLHHLKEIERRRAFSDLKYGSLFEYAVKELGYSEPSANRRIHAARLLATMPELEKKIENGELNLSNMAMASQLFKNEDITDKKTKSEVLAKLENKSHREAELALMPYRDPTPIPKESEKVVSDKMTTVKMNFSNETMSLLDELKGLFAHHRFTNDETMKSVFKIAIEEMKKRKFKTQAKTTISASPGVKRYVPANIRKAVYFRDSGKCTICESRYKLEYDHIRPYALGGKSSVENLRLLCFSCNQRRIKSVAITNQSFLA